MNHEDTKDTKGEKEQQLERQGLLREIEREYAKTWPNVLLRVVEHNLRMQEECKRLEVEVARLRALEARL